MLTIYRITKGDTHDQDDEKRLESRSWALMALTIAIGPA